jgi:hypothetical protein
MQELIRHVDPARRTLGRFFHDKIAVPLDLEFYIGLPREIPDDRLARVKPLSRWHGLLALRYTPEAVTNARPDGEGLSSGPEFPQAATSGREPQQGTQR